MMKVIDCSQEKNENTKKMSDMERGEVCKVIQNGDYVMKVSHIGQDPIFLILGDHKEANSYGASCGLRVRPLQEGESITIKFS